VFYAISLVGELQFVIRTSADVENLVNEMSLVHFGIMNHDSGFIIGIAQVFCKNSNRTHG